MVEIRVDMGAVENSVKFLESMHSINQDINKAGIEVEPANIECPGQNPVERHIQTIYNMEAAITIDQDLLGPEFWGLASLAVA